MEITTNYTEYNHEELYEKKIVPLIDEIQKICKVNCLPCAFMFAPANENGNTKYVYDGTMTGSNDLILYENKFENFLALVRGFNLRPYLEDSDFMTDLKDYEDEIANVFDEKEEAKTAIAQAPNKVTISKADTTENASIPHKEIQKVEPSKEFEANIKKTGVKMHGLNIEFMGDI